MKKFCCYVALCMLLVCLLFSGCKEPSVPEPDKSTTTTTTTTRSTTTTIDVKENMPLEAAFENATKQFQLYPETQRDIGDLQPETQEILLLNGKYYQSYVSESSDVRYVFIHKSEYSMSANWDWVPIGTANAYSFDQLGQIDEGYK